MNCIQRHENQVNIVAAIALTGGLTLAIFSRAFAQASGCSSSYFFIPGASLSGLGIVALAVNSLRGKNALEEGAYRIVKEYHGEFPGAPVLFPRPVKSILPKGRQADFLDPRFYYQVVKGEGDCFYIALISAIFHTMLYRKNFQEIRNKIEELSPEGHERVLALIERLEKSPNKETLASIILSVQDMQDCILLFRKIAAQLTGGPEHAKSRHFANDVVAHNFREHFEVGLCVKDDTYVRESHGIYGGLEEANKCLIMHGGLHFDLLIPKTMLEGIGGSE